ncbi:MAG TPA: von Willebrand factor type A domain-containing protein [Polyangiaceae bacterium]|nr:von Willebrand factor type A domain-containing protein [Polyangiaceae bacterium]
MKKFGLRRVAMGGVCAALLALQVGCSSSADDSSPGGLRVPSSSANNGNPAIGAQPQPATGGSSSNAAAPAGNLGIQSPADADESTQPPPEAAKVTNGFVITAHDPRSTFGADVDTASYDLFRQAINLGKLPEPASVRLEEYVNDFKYAYPPPAEDSTTPFSISLAATPALYGRETQLLRVGIRGKDAKPTEKLKANLVFLVDTSGSMQSPDKLPLVKRVLTDTLDVLQPTDTVSIVTYAGFTSVALAPTPVSNKERIASVIASFDAGGSTAGAAGLDLAYQQAAAGFLEGGLNHVLLCTDGDFNVGPSSTAELVKAIEQKRKSGITLTVLGFGQGLNDSMMEAVSNKGNGVYGVISSEEQADKYVKERMLSTMTFIAKDMKIQVEFNPERVYAYRLLGYEDRAIDDNDFRNDVIDAGEVGAGHRVTALYELALTSTALPAGSGMPTPQDGPAFTEALEVGADALALVKVRYKDRDAAETDPAYEVSQSLLPEQVIATASEADDDFAWAMAVASYAELLRGSPFTSRSILPAIEGFVRRPSFAADPDRAEFVTLFDKASPLLGP